jgi:DNA-binding NtrC family response regulator
MHKAKTNLLIVDDDRNFSSSVRDHLQAGGIEVYLAHTGKDCLDLCMSTQMNILLLDQKLPDVEGADLCASILERNSQTKIIFTTAYPSFDNAVKAVRAGAFDYLSKPFELEELDLVLKQALRTLDLEKVEQFQNYRADVESAENVLVGQSAGIREILRLIDLAATADAPVLITGETGTGKNVAARAVHFRGPLGHEPFIGINCAALPEQLIEAELFGHEKGAFTGAVGLKKGLFEVAEGGTLFLDEIGELPTGLQAKLLGVLDDGTFRRLGGTTLHRARVRVIAATSVDIEKAIRERNFRGDLFYRLGVIKMHLPPLRERKEDLADLCGFLIGRATKGRGVRLADGELDKLAQYDWPGNVRELRNVIERATILQQGADLRPSEFLKMPGAKAARLPLGRASAPPSGLSKTLDEVEKQHILSALEEHGGNFSRAARAVGVSLTTLKRKLQKYRIDK